MLLLIIARANCWLSSLRVTLEPEMRLATTTKASARKAAASRAHDCASLVAALDLASEGARGSQSISTLLISERCLSAAATSEWRQLAGRCVAHGLAYQTRLVGRSSAFGWPRTMMIKKMASRRSHNRARRSSCRSRLVSAAGGSRRRRSRQRDAVYYSMGGCSSIVHLNSVHSKV